ncbi:MAG: hypothetical protein QXX68_00295 [Candidatus Pacearchaeota archaeon]
MADDKKPQAEKDEKYKLKTTPEKLANINYKLPTEGDKWSPDYFYDTFTALRDLQELDLSTKEGRNKFYSIVNDPTIKEGPAQFASQTYKTLVSLVSDGLFKNSLKNIGGLTGLLDNETALSLSLTYPGFYTDDSSEHYKKAAQAVTRFQDVSTDIKNDPEQYLEKRFEGLDESSRTFWSSLSKEILKADQLIAKRRAFEAISAYGSTQKYLAESITIGNRLSQEFSQEQEKLQKEIQEALQKRLQEKGGYLTLEEQAEFEETFKKKQEEFAEKYKQGATASQVIPKLVRDVMGVAYSTIEEQRKKKEESGKGEDRSKSS